MRLVGSLYAFFNAIVQTRIPLHGSLDVPVPIDSFASAAILEGAVNRHRERRKEPATGSHGVGCRLPENLVAIQATCVESAGCFSQGEPVLDLRGMVEVRRRRLHLVYVMLP
jgi:hypothetical protein